MEPARKDHSLRTKTNRGWRDDTPGRKRIYGKFIDVSDVDTTTLVEVEV